VYPTIFDELVRISAQILFDDDGIDRDLGALNEYEQSDTSGCGVDDLTALA
jgi:hypothetical protein